MGHADHQFLDPIGAGTLDDLVDQRNQALATFQAETLGARVLGAQVLFQALGGGQTLQQVGADFRGILRAATDAFQALQEPAALFGIDDVHELCTDRAAICLLQRIPDFAESCFLFADEQFTGAERGIQIGVGQPIVVEQQIGRWLTLPQTQRGELSSPMALQTERLDQPQDFDLLLLVFGTDGTGRDRLSSPLVLAQQHEMVADRGVRNVRRIASDSGQLLEVGAPLFRHSVGIVQKQLIELFHISSITAGQVSAVPQLLHLTFVHLVHPFGRDSISR